MKEEVHAEQRKGIEIERMNGKGGLVRMGMLTTLVLLVSGFIHQAQKSPFKPFADTTATPPEEKVFAGELHYSRVPVEYWEHRILMVKALGLNTLSVYIMWNFHEREDGSFDFQTGRRNLTLFLELATKHHMMVLIRPGPYVCAEWDMGGFPPRLMAIQGLALRQNNQPFLKEVRAYFSAVADVIRPYIRNSQHPDGAIIMLQIENQYGFYGSDMTYIQALRDMWREFGIVCTEYYVDWLPNLKNSHWKGASIGINQALTDYHFYYARTFQPQGMIFGGETYTGWLTRWWEDTMQSKAPEKNMEEYGFLMSHNKSYTMYVAHGGTNFGLTAGSNDEQKEYWSFKSVITSYDYDAPISEQGSATPKYDKLRELIVPYTSWEVPEIPAPIPMMTLPAFQPKAVGSLLENIEMNEKVDGQTFYRFQTHELQMFNQGIVVYQTHLHPHTNYKLNISLHDFGLLVLDGQFIEKKLSRVQEETWRNLEVHCEKDQQCLLQIIVEAHGHCDFSPSMEKDYKGIYFLESQPAFEASWTMYKVPLNEKLFQWANPSGQFPQNQPALMYYNLELDKEPGDTYLDFSNSFYKGYVFVNGHNLGRYWQVGPQYRLFCPGAWLQKGGNDIHVLEMTYNGEGSITGALTLKK